ncbi:MAG: 50S ribosomal protein L21 [Candidatus Eremiobacter antarcticus]|nr:50S ribosomal protein L21 [Candidatus Eremiobacteraeota bacterium]MBC5807165.1 50S ribosomal protein L21 [Candidatus Eremiobacteraeota bacterium]PZR61008.1 MAG: 50S ribosomal protein L21 [Candidatus Eremiobacter sp. RRmetagenome_bin22]
MFAVIEANGKQIRVQEGDVLRLDRVTGGADQEVVFDRVLFAHDGNDFLAGSPLVQNATVTARILRQAKGRKVMVFHYKPKKRIRKRYGHRQPVTELRIEKIALS